MAVQLLCSSWLTTPFRTIFYIFATAPLQLASHGQPKAAAIAKQVFQALCSKWVHNPPWSPEICWGDNDYWLLATMIVTKRTLKPMLLSCYTVSLKCSPDVWHGVAWWHASECKAQVDRNGPLCQLCSIPNPEVVLPTASQVIMGIFLKNNGRLLYKHVQYWQQLRYTSLRENSCIFSITFHNGFGFKCGEYVCKTFKLRKQHLNTLL